MNVKVKLARTFDYLMEFFKAGGHGKVVAVLSPQIDGYSLYLSMYATESHPGTGGNRKVRPVRSSCLNKSVKIELSVVKHDDDGDDLDQAYEMIEGPVCSRQQLKKCAEEFLSGVIVENNLECVLRLREL